VNSSGRAAEFNKAQDPLMKRYPCCVTAIAALLFVQIATAQTQPSQTVQLAMRAVTSGAVDDGIHMLDSLVQAHPDFVQGWAALGQAYRQKQDLSASLTAFERAESLGPPSPVLLFNLGVANALLRRNDAAFEKLQAAKATGQFDITNIDGSPAAANLRDDPRYAELLPTPEELADPFVEPVEILREWRGEARGDVFGWIARNIGDVDGDGIDDVVTSATQNGEAGANAGKVYVYSSGKGELLWTATGRTPGGRFGAGVDAAGDVNADGIPDVVAAAPNANSARVFSGIDGTVLLDLQGSDPQGFFGNHIKGIGDIDGDGHSDILVGEPYVVFGGTLNGGDGSQKGRAHLYSGRDGKELLTLEGEQSGDGFGTAVAGKTIAGRTLFMVGAPNAGPNNAGRVYVYDDLSGKPRWIIDPESTGARLGGMFLSVVGDVNGDGSPDIYASDWGDTSLGTNTGKVYIHSGADGSRLYVFDGEASGDGFGIGVSDAWDVDRDGYDDMLIGGWQNATAAPSGGKLYLYSGKDGTLMRTITGKIPGETLGFDTTGIGDVNGDGTVDFLVTSAYSVVNGWHSGRVFILSGAEN
jgi:hypothetical protein